MISRETIHEGARFLSSNILQHLIYEWSWERVMEIGCVEAPYIYAYPNFPSFFKLNDHEIDPLRFFDMENDPDI
jgi:hypothetical protein